MAGAGTGTAGISLIGVLGNGLMGVTTGVLGNVATSAIAWGLDSVFGLQVGPHAQTQKQITQLTQSLSSINSQLGTISQSLATIEGEIKKISAHMNELFNTTVSVTLSAAFTTAYGPVQSNWTAYTNLTSSAQSAASNNPPAAGTAQQLVEEILNTDTGVPPSMSTMVGLLLPQPSGTLGSNGMLDDWTTMQIQNVVNNRVPIPEAYRLLEKSFLYSLTYIYQGIALIAAAKVCQASQQYITNNPNDPAGAKTAGQQAGIAFLTGAGPAPADSPTAAAILEQLSQFFVQCTHRLVLSTYMRLDPRSSTPAFLPARDQKDVGDVLARASLAYFLINYPGAPASYDPGIVVVTYSRPSQLSANGGPPLTPSPSYPASSGKVFPLTNGYAEAWYKVCDYTDASCATLAAFANSSIAIVDYRWPAPVQSAPPSTLPTQAVGTQGVFAQTFWAWYDTGTLEIVKSPGTNTVAMAFGFDWSAIYDNLFFPAPGQWQYLCWPVVGPTPATSTSFGLDNQDYGYAFYGSIVTPGETGVLNCSFTVTGEYKVPSTPQPPIYGMQMARTLAVAPMAAPATLYLFGSGSFNYTATDPKLDSEHLVPATMTYQLLWGEGSGVTLLFGNVQSVAVTSPQGLTYNWNNTGNMMAYPLQGTGINVALAARVTAQGLHQTDLTSYGGKQTLTVVCNWSIDSTTNIAWQQPAIGA
jgi:hypothetical protein